MCFSLSPWCSRKGEENGNAPGPGKVLFTGCMSTQTLERGICFYTYKAALFRAASDEAGCWNPTRQRFCLSFKAASHRVRGGAQQEALLLLPFCRLCEAAGSRAAACSRSTPLPAWLEAPLLSSTVCSCEPGLCCSAVARLRREQWHRSLCLSPEGKSIPFCKPQSLPLR